MYCGDDEPVFDHERLDVYQLELAFLAWSTDLCDEVRRTNGPATREVRDQLDRAGISSLLNTAEGNGKRQRPVRAKYFQDARGSAMECAACLDALVAKRVCTKARIQVGKEMLLRIVQMLTRMVQAYSDDRVREEFAQYSADLADGSCSSS